MISALLKQIARHSAVYSITYIATSVTALLMLPVFTRYLSKSDYGTVALMDQSLYYINVVFLVGGATAVTRFYHQSKEPEYRRRVIGSGLGLAFAASSVGAGLLLGFAPQLALLVFGSESFARLMRLAAAVLVAQSIFSVSMAYFAAEKRSGTYVAYGLFQLACGVCANLFFIVHLKMGALGMVAGQALSNSLVSAIVTAHVIALNRVRLHWDFAGRLVRFGLPLVPATLLAAVMHNADQYLVRHYWGLAEVGVYALGYKLAFAPYSVISVSIGLVWSSSLMYEVASKPDAKRIYSRMSTYIMSLLIAVLLAVSVFADTIVRVLAAASYQPASAVIPVVALGLTGYALHAFLSIGVLLEKKTWLIVLTHGLAAVSNLGLNVVLIPRYGYMGAAWASVATYAVFAVVSGLVYGRVYAIPFEWARLGWLLVLCIALFLLSRTPVPALWQAFVLKFVALALLPAVLWVAGFFRPEEMHMLRHWYRMVTSRV